MKNALLVLGIALLVASASTYAIADNIAPTPEIPAGSAGSVIAFLSGVVLLIRATTIKKS